MSRPCSIAYDAVFGQSISRQQNCDLYESRHHGAEVTAVDSTKKLDALRAIGADHVIDYTREDFTAGGKSYDVIIDAVGKSPYSRSLRSLERRGRYVLGNPTFSTMIRAPWMSLTSRRTVKIALARYERADVTFLGELIEAGKIGAVIDRCYPLHAIADAHRYVESGQKIGNVVITTNDPPLSGQPSRSESD